MNVILAEEVLSHLHNWFVRDSFSFQNLSIEGGRLPDDVASVLSEGSLYRLEGSVLNDGLHVMGEDDLKDESVPSAKISVLAIPRPLLAMIDEIDEWEQKYGEVSKGPFFSERFGGYQYEIRGYSSYGAASSSMSGWRLAFANRLNPWRKMY